MTNREAIEVLNYLLSTSQSEGAKEAHRMSAEALEKQEPMKPRFKRMPMSMCLSTDEPSFFKVCGSCKELIVDENYCPNCGQAIDWEETE